MPTPNWNIFKSIEPVVADYLEQNHKGNEFLTSLYDQAMERGDLSPRQIECVLDNIGTTDPDGQCDNITRFRTEHEAICDYVFNHVNGNTFMQSLADQIKRKGSLSPRQIEAVERNVSRDRRRGVGHAQVKRETISVQSIYDTFATMKANGLQKPKLRFELFTLSLGKDGDVVWINGLDREGYGRIQNDGVLVTTTLCPPEVVAALREIDSDVIGAAKKYGHGSGSCGVCGRKLDRAESVKMGIGPICAEKLGLGGVRAAEEEKRKAAGSAAEYLLDGVEMTPAKAELPEVEPFPEPDYTPAGLDDRVEDECSAAEYEAMKWGE